MGNFLKYLLCTAAVCAGFSGYGEAAAQISPLDKMIEESAESAVSFSFVYEATNGTTSMSGKGSVTVQDNAFVLEMDGLKVICDSQTRWTVDTAAREMLVEPSDDGNADFSANPALLFYRVDDYFEKGDVSETDFNGMDAVQVRLEPVAYPGLKDVCLYFSAATDLLSGVSVTVSDGTVTELLISTFTYIPKKDISYFRFDGSSLDSSWVVTDLR